MSKEMGISINGKMLKSKSVNKESLIKKINKNIESLNNKIEKLSGNYQVNTYKRMQEQASRDSKIDSYKVDINILNTILNKLLNDEYFTKFEEGLITASFRELIHGYYNRKYGRYPQELTFPKLDNDSDVEGYYNKEILKKQKSLQKYNIHCDFSLNKAVCHYKLILDNCSNIIDDKERQIKNLTNEIFLQQSGDVHFTTNKELLDRLMELADLKETDIVLEPSAGIGYICDEIKKYSNNIETCELNYKFVELLKLKGYEVICNDFLELDRKNYYDKVIANVPFSVEQDHIKHIYHCLKVGGRAVIITSSHYTFASDKKSKDFREWLDSLCYEIQDVRENSFSHTKVNCKILVIDKE